MFVCLALCVLGSPAEDETIGSFGEADDEYDPRNPAGIVSLRKLKKLKRKLLRG